MWAERHYVGLALPTCRLTPGIKYEMLDITKQRYTDWSWWKAWWLEEGR